MPPQARVYLDRARQGSDRLNAMLVAMGAATRVEEAIQSAERMRFDLVPVIASAIAAYRHRFSASGQFWIRSALAPEATVCEIEGAPDLIVQMLDKLVDNAVDFSPRGRRRSPCGCASEPALAMHRSGESRTASARGIAAAGSSNHCGNRAPGAAMTVVRISASASTS